MKKKLILSYPFLIVSLIISIYYPIPTCANFFPNISSIPPSLIPNPNASVWSAFTKLAGCKKGTTAAGLTALKHYFQKFGYLNASYSDFTDDFDDALDSAVRTYQLNFNLNSTGQLDLQTLSRIIQPRCGNPDLVNGSSAMHSGKPLSPAPNSTVAHYSFFPNRPRWPPSRTQLTYAFAPENRLPDNVRAVFARAFDRWSEATTLAFAETANFGGADIRIGFFSGAHGDGDPFDGELGTLAHAYAPTAGRCHLDADENWVIDGNFLGGSPFSAVDLESVAVHEIGHLLGLGHSSVEEAIMYPSIASGVRKVELANDDVLGIQELYGSNPNYNGSGPVLTPRGERDTSGAERFDFIGLLFLAYVILLFFR